MTNSRPVRPLIAACAALAVAAVMAAAGVAHAESGSADTSGLVVEQVEWMPTATGGGQVSVRFKLIDVDELPKHPSITYVIDEATGESLQLQRPVMLPPTSSDPATARSATMVLPDERNVIGPGSTVTVVVAGLIRKGITVEGDAAAAGALPTAQADEVEGELEVLKLMLSGDGHLVDLRYRLTGVSQVRADAGDSYIEVPETGDRLFVLGVARIGTLATKDVGSDRTSFILFNNSRELISAGDRVRVVVAGVARDDVLVEE